MRALIAKEQKSQKKIFGSLRLIEKGMHMTTKCLSGFELYQDIICGRCRPRYILPSVISSYFDWSPIISGYTGPIFTIFYERKGICVNLRGPLFSDWTDFHHLFTRCRAITGAINEITQKMFPKVRRASISFHLPSERNHYDTVCRVCPVPCFPGYFVRYTTGSPVSASTRCQSCPDDFYQDRFGMSTCYSCPGIDDDELNPNVSFSRSFCLGMAYT